MKSHFKKILVSGKNNDTIVIVSGLPRCGTSMMIQMLEAGGMPIVTDNIRKADEDNPRGYYEFEKAKTIKEDTSWLEDCRGKVFKMVSALLYYLPAGKNFKIIFMRRNIAEMLASQRAMLRRLDRNDDLSDKKMHKKFEEHSRKMENWLKRQCNIEVIYVSYNETIRNPGKHATVVNRFLGGRLDEEKMANVVKKSFYRQRKKEVLSSA